MESLGATVETCEIPSQNVLNIYGTCVTATDVTNRRATPAGTVPSCSTVLLFGFKRDLNAYLANKDFGPGVSASSATIAEQTVGSLSDVIAFNSAHADVALKYGQAIAQAADLLDTGPGIDLEDYLADRALDLKLSRACGLDVLYTGVVPAECAPYVADLGSCAGKKFDAVLFPANFGANIAARAGYPSVIVPAGFFPNPATASINAVDPTFNPKPSPFGVTFSGPAFSEPKLIGFAYAFERATHHRVPPPE
jgi:amidase